MLKVNHIYQGNCLDVLKTFPNDCIDCVVTSPPYYGLRSYQTTPQIWGGNTECNHEWGNKNIKKQSGGMHGNVGNNCDDRIHFTSESSTCSICGAWCGELGQEPTFHLFIDHLVEIFMECARVMKKEGSLWINIADSYGGSGNGTHDNTNNQNDKQLYLKQNKVNIKSGIKGYNKSLLGIPERLCIALTDNGLIRRNTIIWHKRNCLPSSVKDRFTNDFEYFYFFTKSGKYYFKQQFESFNHASLKRLNQKNFNNQKGGNKDYKKTIFSQSRCSQSQRGTLENFKNNINKLEGRNKRTVWTLTNKACKDAHFAVFQEELIRTPINACCPEKICVECGKAIEYMYKCPIDFGKGETNTAYPEKTNGWDLKRGQAKWREEGYESLPVTFQGLKQCNCNAEFKPGIVLDPFFGSGTSGKVAIEQSKDFIGIELNPEYIKLAEDRIKAVQIKMF